jgi:pimeloyl-ACP methyl ester carboxylesterase
MPYADNDGVRIHYEVEGAGPPLVLQHAMGASLEHWRIGGYVDLLRDHCQLVLIDSRGHGLSDKPHDLAAYALPLRAADVVAVLDGLGIPRAHYLGYSMGGWIGWGIATHVPERFRSVAMGGFTPLIDLGELRRTLNGLSRYRTQGGIGDYVAAWQAMLGDGWSPEVEAMVAANDLDALIAHLGAGLLSADTLCAIPEPGLPILLYGGALDPFFAGAQQCAGDLPDATVVTLPGMGHMDLTWRSDLVAPMVRKFLSGIDAPD